MCLGSAVKVILTDENPADFRPPVFQKVSVLFGPLVTGLSSGFSRPSVGRH
jgi:hypothetical protein